MIEAVLENHELKKQVFGVFDGLAKPGAILATNSSTLDIDSIAAVIYVNGYGFPACRGGPMFYADRQWDATGAAATVKA